VAAQNHVDARYGFCQLNVHRKTKMAQKNNEVCFRPDFSENAFGFLDGLAKRDSSDS
jgi:hypothetical protein